MSTVFGATPDSAQEALLVLAQGIMSCGELNQGQPHARRVPYLLCYFSDSSSYFLEGLSHAVTVTMSFRRFHVSHASLPTLG